MAWLSIFFWIFFGFFFFVIVGCMGPPPGHFWGPGRSFQASVDPLGGWNRSLRPTSRAEKSSQIFQKKSKKMLFLFFLLAFPLISWVFVGCFEPSPGTFWVRGGPFRPLLTLWVVGITLLDP